MRLKSGKLGETGTGSTTYQVLTLKVNEALEGVVYFVFMVAEVDMGYMGMLYMLVLISIEC